MTSSLTIWFLLQHAAVQTNKKWRATLSEYSITALRGSLHFRAKYFCVCIYVLHFFLLIFDIAWYSNLSSNLLLPKSYYHFYEIVIVLSYSPFKDEHAHVKKQQLFSTCAIIISHPSTLVNHFFHLFSLSPIFFLTL